MIDVKLDTKHWIEQAEASLRRGSLRMAELYMRRGLDGQNPRNYAEVGVE